jgi:3-dehydroquinate synthase
MTTLVTSIKYPRADTDIKIGSGLIQKLASDPQFQSQSARFFIIDTNVLRLHGDDILKPLVRGQQIYPVPAGEKSKSVTSAAKLLKWLHDQQADRKSLLVAIGGGVVTDLSGFVASTYMRGINYISLPTTLVGQVDAAIGGKTAINLAGSKNIVGTFYPPQKILCDAGVLATLKSGQLRDGLVEAIKIFAARNRAAFQLHSAKLESYLSGSDLNRLISDAIRLKVDIVNRDPFESDLRRVLNLGHTAGHAYEALTGHSHGKSVAFGLLVALRLSERLSNLSRSEADSIRYATLKLYHRFANATVTEQSLWERIQHDKKKSGSTVNFVLLKRCGEHVVKSVNYPQFVRALNETRDLLES